LADGLDSVTAREEVFTRLQKESGGVLLTSLLRSHRTAKGLSQEKIARHVGCSTKSWIEWELGRVNPSPEWLPGITQALGLDDRHKWLLYQLVTASVPPPVKMASESDPDFAIQLKIARESIMGSPHVIYIMDETFNVKAHNERFDELYGWTYSGSEDDANRNFMRFVLFHEKAPKVLAHWEEDWLSIALVFYNLATRHNPTNPTLLKIRADMNRHSKTLFAQTETVPKIIADHTGGQPLFELRRHEVFWPSRPDKPTPLYSQIKSINLLPGWLEVVDCSW
jgi:transcriptional regulator with XRE-family HTH domain